MKQIAVITITLALAGCAQPAKNAGMICSQEWDTVSQLTMGGQTHEIRAKSCSRYEATYVSRRAAKLRDVLDVQKGE